MGDFYSVLRQSIIDRGLTTPEAREEAYAQARRAMINRLWAYNPPLAEDEIDQRIGQFDTAVATIEDEVVQIFAGMGEAAAHDDDAGHVGDLPQLEYAPDYPPSFGGHAGEGDPDDDAIDDDVGDADPDADDEPETRPSLDEASRAVELALLAADLDPDPAAAPAAHDEDLAGWSGQDHGETAVDHPPPVTDRRAPPSSKPPPVKSKPAAAPSSAKARPAKGRPSSEQSRVRLLVGVVVALSIVLVGGIVWIVWPLVAPPAAAPIVLDTSAPGGVSDPDTALRLPKEAIAVTNSFSLFDGQDPTVFESDPDNPVRFDGQLARISTSTASAGAKVIIGAGLSSRLAGKTVRVTLDARSARENGATSMRFAYQSGVAISHWQTANLAADFTPLGLVWRVPAMRTDPTGDYIVIEPGLPGSGTGVEIRSVRIDLVDE